MKTECTAGQLLELYGLGRRVGATTLCVLLVLYVSTTLAEGQTINELEAEVAELRSRLAEAEEALASARANTDAEQTRNDELEQSLKQEDAAEPSGIQFGPLQIGGAIRVNYVYGSYEGLGDGPNRGGDGGNVELDTFRINLALDYGPVIGKLEYRWYPADSGSNYNFLHTAWLGYRLDEQRHVEAGLNRVPFGAGPYGISQSWFFDQHYYVGLADDPDLGLKYSQQGPRWSIDLGYYPRSEPSFSGQSTDSARYGYDAVRWNESITPEGDVIFGGSRNGYRERDQFNVRAIHHWVGQDYKIDAGGSLQYGSLEGSAVKDGEHWAVAGHAVFQFGDLTLGTQLSRYKFDVAADNPWGTDQLIPMGAYDFAWPVAARAWLPALSLAYRIDTPALPWLDYALPYIEWSSIIKDEGDYSDSQLFVIGSAWASGGWYIYSDLAYSNGNYFVGNEGDNYSRIDEVGDFGVNGNDRWNYRFNINMGYYY